MEHVLRVEKTARVHTHGHREAPIGILALHGYRQKAANFIRRFEALDNCYVVAPEGLSRFYIDGYNGKVGCTWMTSEGREYDIDNNNDYLEQVVQQFFGAAFTGKLLVLGFSQGMATLTRWMMHTDYPIQASICWAGSPALDIDMACYAQKYRHLPAHIAVGKQDQFFDDSKVARLQQHYSELHQQVHVHRFEGRHDMDSACLQSIIEHYA